VRRAIRIMGVIAAAGLTGRAAVEVLRLVRRSPGPTTRHATAAATINLPADEVYSYWRDFAHLPHFMIHLESVEVTSATTSHWVARAPLGQTIEWDAEIVEDLPAQMIAWRSSPGSVVSTNGVVLFRDAPGNRGTEVLVDITYALPFGAVGDAVAGLFGESPRMQINDDLRRFKQVMETGDIVRSDGSPAGPSVQRRVVQLPGQPVTANDRR
jgi:uncharacterized membrane protein